MFYRQPLSFVCLTTMTLLRYCTQVHYIATHVLCLCKFIRTWNGFKPKGFYKWNVAKETPCGYCKCILGSHLVQNVQSHWISGCFFIWKIADCSELGGLILLHLHCEWTCCPAELSRCVFIFLSQRQTKSCFKCGCVSTKVRGFFWAFSL